MSGYAKRMMEIAAAWHQANPDPDAALKLPRGLEKLTDQRQDIARVDAMIANARRMGRDDLARQCEELLTKIEKIQNDPELSKALDSLSAQVNTPYRLSQSKLERPAATPDANMDDPLWYAAEAPWLLAWARDGYNVFDLSPDFVAAMLLTDPSEIDLPSLRLPFRGMLFMIPDRFAIGAEGTSYTKIHVCDLDDCRDFVVGEARGGERRPAIAIYATDGPRILSTIAPRAELSWAALEELPDDVSLDVDREARKTIQRVVFGALAYATAVDRAITERFPGTPKKRRDQPSIAHWTIGRTIKIDPELVRVARSGAREIAFRIKSRFVVRGHYRNQAHGPSRSLRTMKWIAPFFKGPEEGARLVHTYKPSPEAESNE